MTPRLTIAVLTYRRGAWLAELLPALLAQVREVHDAGAEARVLVVDNDPQGGARRVAETARDGGRWLDYVHEPVPGIVAGRNRALRESEDNDLLIFIDDDEMPSPGWARALVGAWRTTGADAVTGPTPPVYEEPPGQWVSASGVFDSWEAPDGAVVTTADTGNLLLDLSTVRRLGLSFDPRYGLSGGEDSLFTRQLTQGGGVIRFCQGAVVTKRVPRERANRAWVLRRALRMGSSWARVRVDTSASGTGVLRGTYVVKGLGKAVLDGGRSVVDRARGREKERAVHEVSAVGGLGMVLGAAGTQVREYARGRTLPWRRSATSPSGADDATPAPADGGGAQTVEALTIAVPTFRRPEGVQRALREAAAQLEQYCSGPESPMRTQVLVVDNDPGGSARHAVQTVATEYEGRVDLRYVIEPHPGVAAVRNRALDEAGSQGLLIFIDDDEVPGAGWLRYLLSLYVRRRPAAVAGRVVPQYEVQPEEWVKAGGFFDRRSWPTGTSRPVAATNNLLLDCSFVASHHLRFDETFGATGGEDALFTQQLVSAGGTILWCQEAEVRDCVPAERMKRAWVLRRQRSHASTEVRVKMVLAGGGLLPGIRIRSVCGGGARVALGTGLWLEGVLQGNLRRQARAARLMARGLGMAQGAVGRGAHKQYGHR